MALKVEMRDSPIHGKGVFATKRIKKGERVIEYTGPRVTHAAIDAGDTGDAESGHTFFFTLNDEFVIDAYHDQGIAKWINFSCDPNCEALLEETDSADKREDRVFIEAIKDIPEGTELSYNYGITLEEKHTKKLKKIWACHCGTAKCRGTMLQSKKKQKLAVSAEADSKSKSKGKNKKKDK